MVRHLGVGDVVVGHLGRGVGAAAWVAAPARQPVYLVAWAFWGVRRPVKGRAVLGALSPLYPRDYGRCVAGGGGAFWYHLAFRQIYFCLT